MNLPNFLTVLRIALIPVLVFCYFLPIASAHSLAASVFVLASLTDWLDGYIARKFQQVTALGKFLDPVADKLIVAVALVLVLGHSHLPYLTMPAAIIVCREIAVSALREWMAEVGKRASVAVNVLGKLKTAMQMVSLTILLYCAPLTPLWIVGVGYFLVYAASMLTLWSMFMYFKAAWPILMRANQSAS